MRMGGVGVQEFRMGDKSVGAGGGRSRSGVFRSADTGQLKCDGTRAETRVLLSAKRESI